MTPQRELEVMNIEDVKNAEVGQIIATLKKSGRQHGLVVAESEDGKQAVCGILSITQIARQLGTPVQSYELAQTLAAIEAVVSRGK
jgi:hypothetical protein